MMEEVAFPVARIVALGVIGLVLVVCAFALLYWLLGRGEDDSQK
jgi:hypothetical protein